MCIDRHVWWGWADRLDEPTEFRAPIGGFGLDAEHGAYGLGRALRKAPDDENYHGE